jgi:hypothetical protein
METTRRATTMLETIVAFTLLSSVLSVSLPLAVRHGRLLIDQRNYRIALDELTNQLDRLTALPEDDVPAAVGKLAPSEFAETRLSHIELAGELAPADVGRRVRLRLTWGGLQPQTVSMTAWITPSLQSPGEQQRSGEPP